MANEKKANMFAKIGFGISKALVRFAYLCWGLINRILYPPKVVYDSKEVKELLKEKPCILIANHTSHADGSFVPQMLKGRKIYVLITAKWYDKKKLNWMFRRLRYIRINLTEMDNSWMDQAKRAIETGHSVLIFPEGKLSKDGSVDEFLPGFLMLARHTEDVPIVPLAIKGGYQKFHRQTIHVGNPIDYDAHKKGRPSVIFKEGATLCHDTVVELLEHTEA